ncbi:IclR family transcriptional regulator [Musicola paradisiaca]|uniref:Transcriptional regulator, IclR family n=1 Tax=Musicola paradisiaca (strain Ech703) TaxID=579405 RepID=C6CCY5_MUSP7|nr:IclR family transcriptional regulator [Musicola paradisiaca]ACS85026.1 transcriptional regulator, IclR family [Musicola paradisiaca Ech703]
MQKSGGIQVISKAVKILRLLGSQGMSLGDLARQADLPRSTVQRIIDTLAEENLVETGVCGVRLGWGISELAQNAYSNVAARLRHPLEKLFESTRETVDISTFHGREVLFLDRIICDQAVRVVPVYDRLKPMYAMANGKAMLSLMTDEEIVRLVNNDLSALTENTITGIDPLLEEIHQIRATGVAIDRQEHAEGVCAIGIPLVVPGKQTHAISVVVPSYRFEARLPAIRDALENTREACRTLLAG